MPIHIEDHAGSIRARCTLQGASATGKFEAYLEGEGADHSAALGSLTLAVSGVCNELGLANKAGPQILVSVDIVLLTLQDGLLSTVLLRRDHGPFEGVFTIPGGFVHPTQDVSDLQAAKRVLRAKTGLESPYLEQLRTFAGVGRDPRGWSVAIAYYALVPRELLDLGERTDVAITPLSKVQSLPFDHGAILEEAANRVLSKSSYSSLPVHLCGEAFTLPQLQAIYESLMGEHLDKVTFRRKILEMGVVEPIEGKLSHGGGGRPAQLYRRIPNERAPLGLAARAFKS